MNKTFGSRYQVGAMIGTGGMADVYIGDDLRLNRKVAIKVLRSDLARDPSFIARFKKEALAAAGLNHPGIVAVYDSGEEENHSYIVMELVTGHTLRELLNSGTPIPEVEALRITAGILDALEYSHQNGIVHRDIKPSNIMLTDTGDVKVMDFGIARATDDAGATMTSTWNVVGTAQYLSPEQATGEIADGRSDIYSVGCLMYELLTGRTPFTGDTPVAIAYQHVSANFVPPSEIIDGLDTNLDTILSIALAKDPAERYQSAHEMLRDIRLVWQGEALTAKFRRVIPRRNFLILGAAALATILLATAAFLIMPASKSSGTIYQLPNVVGLTEDAAKALLGGFTINISQAPDAHIPVGRVASQLPLATSRVPQGSSVSLTISSGPGNATIPVDLIGKTLSQARDELASAGLVITQTTPEDSNQPPGTVLKVIPDAGSIVPAGSGITLQIASGNLAIPNLVGLSEIEANTIISQAGLLVKTIYATDKTQSANTVLAQAPSAGTTQSIGSSITITVNQLPTN
jgi:serine/threonine-protein kinase